MRRLVILLVVGLVALAGCSNGGDGSNDAGSTQSDEAGDDDTDLDDALLVPGDVAEWDLAPTPASTDTDDDDSFCGTASPSESRPQAGTARAAFDNLDGSRLLEEEIVDYGTLEDAEAVMDAAREDLACDTIDTTVDGSPLSGTVTEQSLESPADETLAWELLVDDGDLQLLGNLALMRVGQYVIALQFLNAPDDPAPVGAVAEIAHHRAAPVLIPT